MDLRFKVHAVVDVPVQRSVEVSPGVKVDAVIVGLRVELTGADDGVGSLTLTFVDPAQIASAKEKFKADEVVTLSA